MTIYAGWFKTSKGFHKLVFNPEIYSPSAFSLLCKPDESANPLGLWERVAQKDVCQECYLLCLLHELGA